MVRACCQTCLLLLVAAATAASMATLPPAPAVNATPPAPLPHATPLPPPPLQHRAEVIVIDVTKHTSSVVAIPLDGVSSNASAAVAAQQLKESASLQCLTQQKVNVFLLVHLNRNWRQKLSFVRRLLAHTYHQSVTNVVVVFFNAFTNILASFGTNPVTSEGDLLTALMRVQAVMEIDEKAAVSAHWAYFQLDEALKVAFRYAKLFLHQFSLDVHPSILLSYFDDGAVISDETVDEAKNALHQFASESPFKASLSVLQWPAGLPVPPQWAKVAEMLSSSPTFQVTGSTEDNLLGLVADVAGEVCNKTMSV